MLSEVGFVFVLLKKIIKQPRTINWPIVLYWCETWSLILREDARHRIFRSMVLRNILNVRRTR